MTKTEIMQEINSTISQIRSCCDYVEDGADARCVADSVEMWLDTLRNEIDQYNDADEEEDDEYV